MLWWIQQCFICFHSSLYHYTQNNIVACEIGLQFTSQIIHGNRTNTPRKNNYGVAHVCNRLVERCTGWMNQHSANAFHTQFKSNARMFSTNPNQNTVTAAKITTCHNNRVDMTAPRICTNLITLKTKHSATHICFSLYPWHLGISKHWQIDRLFNTIFRLITTETSNLPITGFLWGEPNGDQWVPLTKHR